MKEYSTESLRNVALVSHGGAGKSSLAEALLYLTGAVNRLGKIEEGNTVSDFEDEEIRRKHFPLHRHHQPGIQGPQGQPARHPGLHRLRRRGDFGAARGGWRAATGGLRRRRRGRHGGDLELL